MNYPLGDFGRAEPQQQPKVVAFKNAILWTCGSAGIVEGGTHKVLTTDVGEKIPRVNVKEPDKSLLLLKPAMLAPHALGTVFHSVNRACSQARWAGLRVILAGTVGRGMLEVRLLGQFELRRDGTSVLLPSRPAQSLLAYLALSAGTAGAMSPNRLASSARTSRRARPNWAAFSPGAFLSSAGFLSPAGGSVNRPYHKHNFHASFDSYLEDANPRRRICPSGNPTRHLQLEGNTPGG